MKHIYAKLLIGSAFAIACWGAEIPPLPIKGVVAQGSAPDDQGGARSVAVVLRLYSAEVGGQLLYQERQTVRVTETIGMFVAFVGAGSSDGVLARVLDQHATVWGEYSLALTPAINGVGGRQQISHRRSQFVPNLVDVSCKYCYTCGGAYPTFGGYVRSWGDLPYELYIGCSSGYAFRSDSSPYLCCK